jgi:hypothetical protein
MMNAEINVDTDDIRARTKARQEEMLAKMSANTKTIQEIMEADRKSD